jgi:hypothetical protein
MTIISHIRLDMKIKMTDNEINQLINYPAVSFIYLIDVYLLFICRIFDNEKQIFAIEKMLKWSDVFFIEVIPKQKNHQV